MANPPTSKYVSKRVRATILDYLVATFIFIFYILVVGQPDGQVTYSVSGFPALLLFFILFAYFILTERYMGGTLGHHLLKLKVVSLNGESLGFRQVFVRRICDLLEISWCFGLIAYLLATTTDQNQRLGDLLAGTIVIGKEETYPDVVFDFEKQK